MTTNPRCVRVSPRGSALRRPWPCPAPRRLNTRPGTADHNRDRARRVDLTVRSSFALRPHSDRADSHASYIQQSASQPGMKSLTLIEGS
jgi:hypothetical protein